MRELAIGMTEDEREAYKDEGLFKKLEELQTLCDVDTDLPRLQELLEIFGQADDEDEDEEGTDVEDEEDDEEDQSGVDPYISELCQLHSLKVPPEALVTMTKDAVIP